MLIFQNTIFCILLHFLYLIFPLTKERYFKGKLWIIDVSQSVEHDHPHALEFLRVDCANITKFFTHKGGT